MTKRILALLLALVTLTVFAAACGDKTDNDPTEPVDGSQYTTRDELTDGGEELTEDPAPTEETTDDAATTLEGESTSEGDTTAETTTEPGATTTGGSSTTTTAPAAIATPKTTAEIVKFYNNAANNVKKQKNFTAVKDEKLDCHMVGGLLQVVDSALDMLRSDTPNQKAVFVDGKNANTSPQKFLPVSGKSYMSQLEAGWVKSASCVKNSDGSFTIKLSLKDETFLAKSEDPKQHHSCMDTLSVDWNNLGFEVKDDTKGLIHDATITATVTKDGQLLSELHIYEPVQVTGQIKAVVWLNMNVEGYWKQDIKFTY